MAVPTSLPSVGCDALGTCWHQFLTLDELPSLEEMKDILAKQQLEFREIPRLALARDLLEWPRWQKPAW